MGTKITPTTTIVGRTEGTTKELEVEVEIDAPRTPEKQREIDLTAADLKITTKLQLTINNHQSREGINEN